MYEYKTIVQDVVPDLDVQQKLDDDLNLICQRGNWEVFSVTAVSFLFRDGEAIIQNVYTLRRRDATAYTDRVKIVEEYLAQETKTNGYSYKAMRVENLLDWLRRWDI